jgi:uncharacterized protein (TIGR02453 family)
MPGHFTAATFRFLRELEENNDRAWWEQNKQRYIEDVRDPAVAFIADIAGGLATISPHFVADARSSGGSLMRPYRDIRFSADKTPYKTNVGIQFRHEAGKDVHAPGFYVHLEPSRCFAGAGLWSPETSVAAAIRRAIDEDPSGWGRAAHDAKFERTWSLGDQEEDRLRRVPAGLKADHAYVDDLRLKSFVAGRRLTQREVTSADFTASMVKSFKETGPLVRFLCRAIGLPY